MTRVDLFHSDQWNDITSDVRLTNAHNGITIHGGRANEQSGFEASRCNLWLNNRTGTYSPRNPTSSLYGLIGRNTPIRVARETAEDAFGTDATNGWGTATIGGAWSTNGGVAGDYSASSGTARISVSAVNSIRETYLGTVSIKDVWHAATFKPGVIATGGSIQMAVTARRADASNYYYAGVVFGTAGTAQLALAKRIAGVVTQLEASSSAIAYTSSTSMRIELTISGSSLFATMYDVAAPATTVDIEATDTDLTAAGAVGARVFLSSTNTNTLPLTVQYDNVQTDDVRFTGEVSSWPARWDVSGTDVWVPIEASGVGRRLAQSPPLRSALYRTLSSRAWERIHAGTLQEYWAFEDGANASLAGSAIGGPPASLSGSVTFASSGPDGSQPLPDFAAGGRLSAQCRTFAVPTNHGWWAMCVFKLEGTGPTAYPLEIHSSGTLVRWRVTVTAAGVTLDGYDADGVSRVNAVVLGDYTGGWHVIGVEVARTAGTEVTGTIYTDADDGAGASASSYTVGSPTRIMSPGSGTPSNVTSLHVGHVSVWSRDDLETYGLLWGDGRHMQAMNGYSGETAGERMARLCDEENVSFALTGTATDTGLMGPQRVASLMTLLQDAEAVDQGILFEPRGVLGISYRTLRSLYNQTAALALDYEGSDVSPPFEPTEDDQAVRNLVTVSRIDGSSSTVEVTTGPLSTASPPDGVGTYTESVSVNAASDSQLDDLAGWRAHIGTWDEARYPRLRVELERPGSTLVDDALSTGIGDVATVDNPPSWLPPDQISILAVGYTEEINVLHNIEWNCVPAGPYQVVGVAEDNDLGLVGSDGSTVNSAFVAGTGTSLSVAVASGYPLWVTGSVDFDVIASGVVLHVTSISGASSPQTFTVDQTPVNGVVKTIPAGSEVWLYPQPVTGL